MGVNWVDHGVDFVVIFLADVCAAYVAVKWIESHRAEEEQKLSSASLNKLFRISGILSERYATMINNFKNSSDSTATGLSTDITDIDREFAELDKDFLFWSFPKAQPFREKYDAIKTMKQDLSARTVGEARRKLGELVEGTSKLKSLAEEGLKPRLPFWTRIKSKLSSG